MKKAQEQALSQQQENDQIVEFVYKTKEQREAELN